FFCNEQEFLIEGEETTRPFGETAVQADIDGIGDEALGKYRCRSHIKDQAALLDPFRKGFRRQSLKPCGFDGIQFGVTGSVDARIYRKIGGWGIQAIRYRGNKSLPALIL